MNSKLNSLEIRLEKLKSNNTDGHNNNLIRKVLRQIRNAQ